MEIKSLNNIKEAATELAYLSIAMQPPMEKQADVDQILNWFRTSDYGPVLAGSLLGAGGGGLFGLVSSYGKEEDERNPIQSALTGALGGGILGAGGGLLAQHLPDLLGREATRTGKNPMTRETDKAVTNIVNRTMGEQEGPESIIRQGFEGKIDPTKWRTSDWERWRGVLDSDDGHNAITELAKEFEGAQDIPSHGLMANTFWPTAPLELNVDLKGKGWSETMNLAEQFNNAFQARRVTEQEGQRLIPMADEARGAALGAAPLIAAQGVGMALERPTFRDFDTEYRKQLAASGKPVGVPRDLQTATEAGEHDTAKSLYKDVVRRKPGYKGWLLRQRQKPPGYHAVRGIAATGAANAMGYPTPGTEVGKPKTPSAPVGIRAKFRRGIGRAGSGKFGGLLGFGGAAIGGLTGANKHYNELYYPKGR